MRFPFGKAKALTFSYDDGVEQDVKLMEIFNKYGLKATFNINSGLCPEEEYTEPRPANVNTRRLSIKSVIELYKNSGHEVAMHTFSHPLLTHLPNSAVTYEILKDKEYLEEFFDTIITGFAYPFGNYNDDVINCLKACGVEYARTADSSGFFNLPTDFFKLTGTCHHEHPKLMEKADFFINEIPKREPWLFYVWGHSYEFDLHNNWHIIENIAEKMSGNDDIWYATNIDICHYIKDFYKLVLDTKMKKVFNPTAQTLWFLSGDKILSIKSGETLNI